LSTERVEIRIPRESRHIGAVRTFFSSLARESDGIQLSEKEIGEIQLVLQEACINSIRHAGPASREEPVSVSFELLDDRLRIEVRDHGMGFDPDSVPIPKAELLQEGGYGVYIMKQSMDRVVARRDGDGFVLSLTKIYRVGSPDVP
jgi:serine/threonine-protein kinase RsbW